MIKIHLYLYKTSFILMELIIIETDAFTILSENFKSSNFHLKLHFIGHKFGPAVI